MLVAAGDHGLDPSDYDAASLTEQWQQLRTGGGAPPDRALFDMALAVGAARMLRAVHLGRVDPATMLWGYHIERKKVDPAGLLREVREGKGLAALLDDLQPDVSHYARARRRSPPTGRWRGQGRARARTLVAQGADEGGRRALRGLACPNWRRDCGCCGDLAEPLATTATYTGPLVDAVKRFQERHGLAPDGVIGPGTIRAINVPLAQRVRQIELAMERMRWLPPLGDRPERVRERRRCTGCGPPIP